MRWCATGEAQGAPAMNVGIFHWLILFVLIGGAAGTVWLISYLANRRK
ncbi:hypothetical protein GLE_4307 [Lysobacter enzymogenes]|uniref:Uncharacterized protein n=1 Tax=Lysobacter enzymogenes TaxID=69 RepID=A0A0S2DM74_LYSEN|nr:hypothetical protein GLE_4307 [Lysobacter enzymogenes]